MYYRNSECQCYLFRVISQKRVKVEVSVKIYVGLAIAFQQQRLYQRLI